MTPRRPPPAEGAALFAVPAHHRGATERAMERDLSEWRAAGRRIDAAISKTLRAQAHAVDLAEGRSDPWQIGNANRVLLELLRGYGLVETGNAADPFAAMMERLGGMGGHDDNGDQGAAGAAVPDSA